jgi:hypothetical protein
MKELVKFLFKKVDGDIELLRNRMVNLDDEIGLLMVERLREHFDDLAEVLKEML